MGRRPVSGLVRFCLAPCLALFVALGLSACGRRSSDIGWAQATARTCRSTIARVNLADPTPAQIAPERFLAERQRLLDGHQGFNTVTAFRNVCSKIRREMSAESSTTTAVATTATPPSNAP